MKTKVLLFLFLILAIKNSFSQYNPVLNNSSWIFGVHEPVNQSFTLNEAGEITVGAYTYKKFIDPYLNRELLIREDVPSKKVYRIVDGQDVLLFDFNLNINDIITLENGRDYRVYEIGNRLVMGGQRKKIDLAPVSNFPFLPEEHWIEGVGNQEHPLIPTYEINFDPEYSLVCSFQNGINIYNLGLVIGGTAADCAALNVSETKYLSKKMNFAPNPFQIDLVISTEKSLKNSTLIMYNSIGQIVKEISNLNGNKIILKRENLTRGLYLIQLFENGKIFGLGKVIISD